jgi:hypothetical protein
VSRAHVRKRHPLAGYVSRRARGEVLLPLDDSRLIEFAKAMCGTKSHQGPRTATWFGSWSNRGARKRPA